MRRWNLGFSVAVAALLLAACGSKDATVDNGATTSGPKSSKPKLTELKIEDIEVGSGATAEKGDLVLLEFEGLLADDSIFDSSERGGGYPFAFTLGSGEVIPGWDQGVPGMKVGGKRSLGIPSELGYGKPGSGAQVPPDSDLYFTVKLLDIVKQGQEGDFGVEDVKTGDGPPVKTGDTVSVHYTGTLVNGHKFDSSLDRGQPFEFTVGQSQVIKGWDAGLVGMRKGGVRKLRIPPALAYGRGGQGEIGPNQVLLFEIELVEIKP